MGSKTDLGRLMLSLQSKIEKLVHLHRKSEDENKRLRDSEKELLNRILLLEKEVSEQRRINLALKTGKTLENEEGSKEIKTKINELVREIDKCIGLLNK